jgi:hypothetical protein
LRRREIPGLFFFPGDIAGDRNSSTGIPKFFKTGCKKKIHFSGSSGFFLKNHVQTFFPEKFMDISGKFFENPALNFSENFKKKVTGYYICSLQENSFSRDCHFQRGQQVA